MRHPCSRAPNGEAVATIKARPIAGEDDALLAAVKAWPGDSGNGVRPERRPALTAAARGVFATAGRDEETVRPNKETRSGGWPACDFRRFFPPGRAASDDCVGEDQQLSGASDQSAFMLLACPHQLSIERDELRIPAKGRR